MGKLLERLTRGAAHVHAGDRGIAQRQDRSAQLILAEAADVVEVAEFGQRVGETRHGRLRQAGAFSTELSKAAVRVTRWLTLPIGVLLL